MQKLALFLFFLAHFGTISLAQDIRLYHRLVNQAELSIVQGAFNEALDLYRQAFEEDFSHFSKDYNNALLCAIEQKNDALCEVFVQKLIERNVPEAFFDQPQFDFLKSKINLPDLYSRISPLLDSDLMDTLKLMVEEDQQFRTDNLAAVDSIPVVDEINYRRLIAIFKKYGYPSELLLGTNMMRNNRRIGTRGDFDILLTHQLKNGRCELMAYLEKALFDGQLNPEVFVSHAGYCDGEELRLGCFGRNQEVFFQMDSLIFTCDTLASKKINAYREKYFLCSVDELKQKIGFAYQKTSKVAFSLHCNYAVTYRMLNGNDLDAQVLELEKQTPGMILFKKLDSAEPYFW